MYLPAAGPSRPAPSRQGCARGGAMPCKGENGRGRSRIGGTPLYSLTVPAGWSCNGYDSSVEIEAPEAINNIIPNISVTVGPCDGDFSKITFDDMKENFGTLIKDIEKISFGIKTIGENECLIIEFSYSVLGMQQFVSQAIVHAGSQDLTFTLVRDSLMTASAEFQNVLESLEINPLARQS